MDKHECNFNPTHDCECEGFCMVRQRAYETEQEKQGAIIEPEKVEDEKPSLLDQAKSFIGL